MYVFIKVNESHSMTYQYVTDQMVKAEKANHGLIDKKTFKTVGKYGFDSDCDRYKHANTRERHYFHEAFAQT